MQNHRNEICKYARVCVCLVSKREFFLSIFSFFFPLVKLSPQTFNTSAFQCACVRASVCIFSFSCRSQRTSSARKTGSEKKKLCKEFEFHTLTEESIQRLSITCTHIHKHTHEQYTYTIQFRYFVFADKLCAFSLLLYFLFLIL